MKELDMKAIQQQLKESADNRNMETNPVSFEDIYMDTDIEDFDIYHKKTTDIEDLKDCYEIDPKGLIQGNPIVVFIKKVIRKLSSFLVVPLANNQSIFNQRLIYYLEAKEKENKNINADVINEMQKKIDKLEEELRNLKTK